MTYEYQSIRWMADHWLSSQATPKKRFKENSELREKSGTCHSHGDFETPQKTGWTSKRCKKFGGGFSGQEPFRDDIPARDDVTKSIQIQGEKTQYTCRVKPLRPTQRQLTHRKTRCLPSDERTDCHGVPMLKAAACRLWRLRCSDAYQTYTSASGFKPGHGVNQRMWKLNQKLCSCGSLWNSWSPRSSGKAEAKGCCAWQRKQSAEGWSPFEVQHSSV